MSPASRPSSTSRSIGVSAMVSWHSPRANPTASPLSTRRDRRPKWLRDVAAATDRLFASDEPKIRCRAQQPMTRADGPPRLRVATSVDDADRAVLVRIADGELDALEDLYDRYKTMAYSIAYRITNDRDPGRGCRPGRLPRRVAQRRALRRGSWQRQDVAAVDRPSPLDRCRPAATSDHRIARRRDVDAGGLDDARRLGRGLGRPRCRRPSEGRSKRVVRRPARSDRAGLFRRVDPTGDRRAAPGAPLGTVKSRMRLGLLAMRRSLEAGSSWIDPATAGSAASVR